MSARSAVGRGSFYPRPHAEGDQMLLAADIAMIVSTHAPTRRATALPHFSGCTGEVSTHAPTRRATCRGSPGRGEQPVSTHAPTRRATLPSDWIRAATCGFYPRPHAEGDCLPASTSAATPGFYPRPHAEGDVQGVEGGITSVSVSTHAPTRRATGGMAMIPPAIRSFYPRPHAEGDTWSVSAQAGGQMFLPTPPRGGRRSGCCCCRWARIRFYPRPHAEGDALPALLTAC